MKSQSLSNTRKIKNEHTGPKKVTVHDGVELAMENLTSKVPSNLAIPTSFYQFSRSNLMLQFLDAILKYFDIYFIELAEKEREEQLQADALFLPPSLLKQEPPVTARHPNSPNAHRRQVEPVTTASKRENTPTNRSPVPFSLGITLPSLLTNQKDFLVKELNLPRSRIQSNESSISNTSMGSFVQKQRRQAVCQKQDVLATVAKAYSTLLLHCSNFENNLEDQRFFEVLIWFTILVIEEVFADMEARFDAVEAEIDHLFRGGTEYFNPQRYKKFSSYNTEVVNKLTFVVPNQGVNVLPAKHEWESRSKKTLEFAKTNVTVSERIRLSVGQSGWRAQQIPKPKRNSNLAKLSKGYINSKIYNKSPVLTTILPADHRAK